MNAIPFHKPSTHLSAGQFEYVVELGRHRIEQAAAQVKNAGGRWVDENLEFLRRAWKVAPVLDSHFVVTRSARYDANTSAQVKMGTLESFDR